MAMHACQIGPTDTAPPCLISPLRAYVGTPPFACTQRGKHFDQSSINSRIMARRVSLAAFTISAFSESRFWCLRVQAHSLAQITIYSAMNLRSKLEEGQSSIWWNLERALVTIFAGFLLCEQVQNPAESTTRLHLQMQFPPEVIRYRLSRLGRPSPFVFTPTSQKEIWVALL